jgi:hypothetical protein
VRNRRMHHEAPAPIGQNALTASGLPQRLRW